MTIEDFLNVLDHEVWVRVRLSDGSDESEDIVIWSADWIMDKYVDKVKPYLKYIADDVHVETHTEPCVSNENVEYAEPMVVVVAYKP